MNTGSVALYLCCFISTLLFLLSVVIVGQRSDANHNKH